MQSTIRIMKVSVLKHFKYAPKPVQTLQHNITDTIEERDNEWYLVKIRSKSLEETVGLADQKILSPNASTNRHAQKGGQTMMPPYTSRAPANVQRRNTPLIICAMEPVCPVLSMNLLRVRY